ncbi:MAG TPA: hypothetical protein VMW53_05360 [archaeon]|nr:hypothetical protein [archaeon]
MTGVSMRPVASARGVDIFCPEDGKFAFLKSPFAAHTTLSAIDIYSGGTFGDIAPSPVEGEVIDIREYPSPTPFKDRDFMEYIIAIRQDESVVKILHSKPVVEVGDTVDVGDPLGILIKNGYFYFWNEPPLHVEVRNAGDYIRASNDNPLSTKFSYSGYNSMESNIKCRVVFCNEKYALLKGDYKGAGVKGYELGGCLLDGIIRLGDWDAIDYFGLIGTDVPVPCMRSVGNRFMISVKYVTASISTEKPVDCRALGFSLSFTEPAIKLIPLKYGEKLFDVGDCVDIKLNLLND